MHGNTDATNGKEMEMKSLLSAVVFTLLLIASRSAPAEEKSVYPGEPRFAYGFSSHMVLQRDIAANVWGFANPGTTVTVSIGDQNVTAKADPDGKWQVQLAPMQSGGPYVLKLASGKTVVKLDDVMLGDVWICAGQSNMRFSLDTPLDRFRKPKALDTERLFADELAAILKQKEFPIRHVMGGKQEFNWLPVTYENVRDRKKNPPGVTAVGYFFAKHLRQSLGDVPIGIIQAGNGGAAIREFLPKEVQWADPGMYEMNQPYWKNWIKDRGQEKLDAYYRGVHAWLAQKDVSGPCPVRYIGRVPGHNFYNHFAPLKKLKFKGMLYYQGEGDAGRGYFYRHLLRTLATVCSDYFEFEEMPFLTVLLPGSKRLDYTDIVESQLHVADTMKGVHAVYAPEGTWDHPKDLHPPNKEIIGKRAAMTALHEVYGRSEHYLGPRYASHKVVDNTIIVTFQDTGGGLVLKEGAKTVTCFEMAGSDRKFVAVKARLGKERNKVVLSIPEELQNDKQPVHVRFQWKKYYEPVLYGKNGLPAVFFRTDDFETRTSVRTPKSHVQR